MNTSNNRDALALCLLIALVCASNIAFANVEVARTSAQTIETGYWTSHLMRGNSPQTCGGTGSGSDCYFMWLDVRNVSQQTLSCSAQVTYYTGSQFDPQNFPGRREIAPNGSFPIVTLSLGAKLSPAPRWTIRCDASPTRCTAGAFCSACPSANPYLSVNNSQRCCSQPNYYACINNSTGENFCSSSSTCGTGGGGGSSCTGGAFCSTCPSSSPYLSVNHSQRCCSQPNYYACINTSTGQEFCSSSSTCSTGGGGGGGAWGWPWLLVMAALVSLRGRRRYCARDAGTSSRMAS